MFVIYAINLLPINFFPHNILEIANVIRMMYYYNLHISSIFYFDV